ncbi:MAG TPA: AraC family transcriptional regulator [Candidatus Sulfotelmatobacter sp.]|jgi:AraC-like DNA-binding protein|nr:AraC family transcriptional regulator [Candidatus Sulfotelmatobacter sp.]
MNSSAGPFYHYFPVSRRDVKWGLYANTAGEVSIASNTAYPPGGHPKDFAFDWQHGRILDGFAIVYISSGRGKFESQSVSTSIEPGDTFLLFPGVWHRYAPDPETGWYEHWIGFDGETARNWLRKRFISPKKAVFKISPEDTVLATFSRVGQSVRANRPALQQILAGAITNLMGLVYSTQQTQPAAESQNVNNIELAIAHMQNALAPGLDLELLAKKLGVSYSWFRKAFVAHTGLSPYQYLLELRLVRARRLLVETEFSVKEIAMQTGFKDQFYFSRHFRRKMNLTATEWRRRSRRQKVKHQGTYP